MDEDGLNIETAVSGEGNEDLNGKNASYRNASMISPPRVVMKRRIRGALVPMGNKYETFS